MFSYIIGKKGFNANEIHLKKITSAVYLKISDIPILKLHTFKKKYSYK